MNRRESDAIAEAMSITTASEPTPSKSGRIVTLLVAAALGALLGVAVGSLAGWLLPASAFIGAILGNVFLFMVRLSRAFRA